MSYALALLIAAVSGFIALSYEILWYRVIAFASWGLPSAFGLLLAAYLFGVAVGSQVAGRFCRDGAAYGDPRQLRRIAPFVLVANVVAWLVVPFFARSAKVYDWPASLAAVALAAALLGAVLPLVSHFGIAPDDRAGQRLGFVYLANIVGSAAGSLVTGFVFLDVFSLRTIGALVFGVGLVLVAAILALSGMSRRAQAAAYASLAAFGAALVLATPTAYDRVWERLLYKTNFEDDTTFASVVETKSGVITVTDDGTVYGGGAYDGRFNTSIVDDRNGILRAYAIGAMHPSPENVLMIGLSSGSWATVVSNLPRVARMTIVEINPGYVKLIAEHPEVAPLLRDPKVEIVIDDGRRWLQRSAASRRFDVIVMNTTWHWRAHITSLLSTEFMELARAHLAPSGIFYFNTTSSEDVQKTAASTFPFALRVYNFMAVSDAPLVFDASRWKRTLETFAIGGVPAIDTTTEDGQKTLQDLLEYPKTLAEPPVAHGLESRESILARTAGARLVTDDNMVPEWREALRFEDPPRPSRRATASR